MAKKLSAKTQQKLEIIEEGRRKSSRVYSLIEQYAAAKKGQDAYAGQIKNAATDLGRVFMNGGLGVMADTANQIAMLAKRGGATATKFRGLRELVGGLGAALDRQEKMVLELDAMDKEKADATES